MDYLGLHWITIGLHVDYISCVDGLHEFCEALGAFNVASVREEEGCPGVALSLFVCGLMRVYCTVQVPESLLRNANTVAEH